MTDYLDALSVFYGQSFRGEYIMKKIEMLRAMFYETIELNRPLELTDDVVHMYYNIMNQVQRSYGRTHSDDFLGSIAR